MATQPQPLYRDTKNGRSYLNLFGHLHWIDDVKDAIFGLEPHTLDEMPIGISIGWPLPPGSPGAHGYPGSCLVKSEGDAIFLYVANTNSEFGTLYWISDVQAKEFYQFNGPIRNLSDLFPKGPNITMPVSAASHK